MVNTYTSDEKNKKVRQGILYVVATPIGNLDDISQRARSILEQVDKIAAEDTRHSAGLLSRYGITTPMIALHEHNERELANDLVEQLLQGENMALISDAGTPLMSDPGYHLVRKAREKSIKVSPVPGACAMIAALSVAGLATDRFVFEGFLSPKKSHREKHLQSLIKEQRTLVFYEAPHRIVDLVDSMALVFGGERQIVITRELTKKFEQIHQSSLDDMIVWLNADLMHIKGEFVVLLEGASEILNEDQESQDEILSILLDELPVKQASQLASRITGRKKNVLYKRALELKQ